ncbi:MAG: PepSY-like domain-containing protein [Prevotellaceae bacterium]|nr:PepSY-like domain-containing protein [Prevotellaceae bacterium]
MKTNFSFRMLFAGLLLFGFLSCTNAQEPAITKLHSNEQIAQMLAAFQGSPSRDVTPSAALQRQLLADFPKARDIEWETDGKIFEAEFEVAFADYKAFYDAEGNLVMFSVDISRSQVPAEVKNAVKTEFPRHRIEDATRIVQGTETFYKVELERGEIEIKATFKADGTFVR